MPSPRPNCSVLYSEVTLHTESNLDCKAPTSVNGTTSKWEVQLHWCNLPPFSLPWPSTLYGEFDMKQMCGTSNHLLLWNNVNLVHHFSCDYILSPEQNPKLFLREDNWTVLFVDFYYISHIYFPCFLVQKLRHNQGGKPITQNPKK